MVGKRVRGALYVHREATSLLEGTYADSLAGASRLAAGSRWNVARIERDVIGLLEYEDFELSAFPKLLSATRVELKDGTLRHTSYLHSSNPLILHRKELLVARRDERTAKWAAATAMLAARGAFVDNHLIGRSKSWTARLAALGLVVDGDEVRAA